MPAGTKEMKVGILAGGGALPKALQDRLSQDRLPFFTIGLHGFCDQALSDRTLKIGQAKRILRTLQEQYVTDVVLIGSVRRPDIFSSAPDGMTLRFLLRAVLGRWGDDRILREARKIIEEFGTEQKMRLRGVHVFISDILMPEGEVGRVAAPSEFEGDIALGIKAARLHGKADKGQAVLVKEGRILARESRKGTSALILEHGQAGAILIKTAKPQQDGDLDLPALGVETVRLCAEQKMAGIIGQAGKTLLIEREEMVKLADANNLFITGVTIP